MASLESARHSPRTENRQSDYSPVYMFGYNLAVVLAGLLHKLQNPIQVIRIQYLALALLAIVASSFCQTLYIVIIVNSKRFKNSYLFQWGMSSLSNILNNIFELYSTPHGTNGASSWYARITTNNVPMYIYVATGVL